MQRYNPKDIEPKWQKTWQDSGIYKAVDFDAKPKYVMLTEFPYPSGIGIHLGHVREYTYGDILARHKRMQGFNVLYPMGYDEFGLPTENYAIKNKVSPQSATEVNVANFQKQLESLGYSFDWDRAVHTSDPDYYKWTQWLFLQFYKAGLAYQDEIAINWCPHCKTGLSNEEVVNSRHERCDTVVEKKFLKQWLMKITQYADRLIEGLKSVDYPSRIGDQQVNWIGRSKGAEIEFAIDGHQEKLGIFTTRPDTLFGATFMVLAPEHALVQKIMTLEHKATVNGYIKAAQGKTEIERQSTDREKTGVATGAHAINPVNGEKIPIWIADYVLTGYGTGAIMAVPAHDERDYAFAHKYNLNIRQVVGPSTVYTDKNAPREGVETLDRRVVDAIIKNQDDQYLLLVEEDNVHFVGGGVDPEDADDIAAVRREVVDESGYTDIASIKIVTPESFAHGYRFPKGINQKCQGIFYEVTLASDTQITSEADEGRHTLRWAAKNEVESAITWQAHSLAWKQYLAGDMLYSGQGLLLNSGEYNGLSSQEAKEKIVADLAAKGLASEKINYRLRDWVFSRQHYWGEPIPIIHCEEHGAVAVPEDQLPVVLPPVDHYEPTDNGESPLSEITEWVNTVCPTCGMPAKRETDTMPNWAGSSWYYLRYYDAQNQFEFADRQKLDYWKDVDLYLGGMEHTTLHLLYSRFWHEFLFDQGLVPTPEPYAARRGQGLILAADGTKMSKSKGNVVDPKDIIDSGYGADALRMAISFLAPYDQSTSWSPEAVAGTHRLLSRIWTLVQEFKAAKPGQTVDVPDMDRAVHKTIKKVSEDLDGLNFNTAIAAMMELTNQLYIVKSAHGYAPESWQWALESLLQLAAPFAPHITEELWQQMAKEGSIHQSDWPAYDEKFLLEATLTIAIQVNGKLRGEITVPADATEDEVVNGAKNNQKVAGYLAGQTIRKTIYVAGKLVSFVI